MVICVKYMSPAAFQQILKFSANNMVLMLSLTCSRWSSRLLSDWMFVLNKHLNRWI